MHTSHKKATYLGERVRITKAGEIKEVKRKCRAWGKKKAKSLYEGKGKIYRDAKCKTARQIKADRNM